MSKSLATGIQVALLAVLILLGFFAPLWVAVVWVVVAAVIAVYVNTLVKKNEQLAV